MKTVTTSIFRPFADGHPVVRLGHPFDPEFIRIVKDALAAAEPIPGHSRGGWLPEHKTWFCELAVLPFVRLRLQRAGYRFVDGTEPDRAPPAKTAPLARTLAKDPCQRCRKLPALLEEWAWQMRVGHDDQTHPLIEQGLELLRELVLQSEPEEAS
jgi:hypothetical protein